MKQHRTLWRGLGILLALTMGLCLLAATALAETETADFTGDTATALALLTKGDGSKATWDSKTNTLTLKGVSFSTSADTAVKLPAGSTIVLAEGTKNTITSTSVNSYGLTCFCGIYVDGGQSDHQWQRRACRHGRRDGAKQRHLCLSRYPRH